MDYRLIGRDGRVVWVHDESVVVHDEDGAPLCAQGFLLDITERIHMEDALRRSEAILQAVSFAAERFLRARSWRDVIVEILARLGEAASASRVYIFENEVTAGLGYRVIEAENGAQALERAATEGRIDLLVTDVVMPAVGGSDLAQRLGAERPGLRVLFVSG